MTRNIWCVNKIWINQMNEPKTFTRRNEEIWSFSRVILNVEKRHKQKSIKYSKRWKCEHKHRTMKWEKFNSMKLNSVRIWHLSSDIWSGDKLCATQNVQFTEIHIKFIPKQNGLLLFSGLHCEQVLFRVIEPRLSQDWAHCQWLCSAFKP